MDNAKPTARKRIAIVGGGPAALATAFSLTQEEPNAYEITVYEMSWRLGGKTASGRGEDGRIEEHGLHILFGCYHNLFRILERSYTELREKKLFTPEEHCLQHFHDAIAPHHFGVIGDDTKKPWERIELQFPSNRGVPGDPPLPSFLDLCLTLFQIIWAVVIGARSVRMLQICLAPLFDYRNRWKHGDFAKKRKVSHHASHLGGGIAVRLWLKVALAFLDNERVAGKLTLGLLRFGHRAWGSVRRLYWGPYGRWWSSLDFFFAMFKGLLADRVLSDRGGFERVDDEDLRAWLKRHGAAEQTLASPWMRIIYDAAFSYVGGREEAIAAGAALRTLLVMTITFKGAFYNKMEAGMGDIIHTPLYKVLKARGVRFEFFHKLSDVRVGRAEGEPVVEELEFDTLPEPFEYDPLVCVERLMCWPSKPLLGRLPATCHARALEAESYAPSSAARRQVKLRRGDDFDLVVLGIPVACLPHACPSLLAAEAVRPDRPTPSFLDQAEIDTVQTMALQLWLKPSLSDLGWKSPSPLTSLFVDPLNTWCDMSHLLSRESWTCAVRPKNVAYFCGAIPHEFHFPRADELSRDPGAANRARMGIEERSAEVARTFLVQDLYQLLPTVRSGDGFNFNLIIDRDNGSGEERMRSTFWKVNYEPQALCTLALPTKTRFRMHPDQTGYVNLFVTGDWINNGVYVACVEGAVQAGIGTARALSRAVGGHYERYSIVAEELLNLQVFSTLPDKTKPRGHAAAPETPAPS